MIEINVTVNLVGLEIHATKQFVTQSAKTEDFVGFPTAVPVQTKQAGHIVNILYVPQDVWMEVVVYGKIFVFVLINIQDLVAKNLYVDQTALMVGNVSLQINVFVLLVFLAILVKEVPQKRTEHIPITTSLPKWCSHHMGWRPCTQEKTKYRTVHITTYRTIYYCDWMMKKSADNMDRRRVAE